METRLPRTNQLGNREHTYTYGTYKKCVFLFLTIFGVEGVDAPDDLLDRTEVGLPGLELEEGGGTDTVGGGRLVTELDLGRKKYRFLYICTQ